MSTTFSTTNRTADRSFDVNSTSINELADVIGTIIADYYAGTYNGGSYTVTNASADRAINCNSTSITELAKYIGKLEEERAE